jgi:hypothetical protein
MRRILTMAAFCVPVLAALIASNAFAQEGFPLDGTWRGSLSAAPSARAPAQVVLVMSWDGEEINGVINPGPRAMQFSRASLDPSTWSVRIEAQPADAEPIVIEGTLENIGSYNRYIEGTWTQGGDPQPIRITRE